MQAITSRMIFTLIFAGCTFLMGVALFMEHYMALEPCPLCILQRVMVIIVALIALVAAIHHPDNLGIRLYGVSVVIAAVIGGAISSRQLWLQSLPEDEVPACGPSLDYLMDVFPPTEVLNMVLAGDGTCAEVVWSFLGLSIPGWTLVGFIGLAAFGIFQSARPLKH